MAPVADLPEVIESAMVVNLSHALDDRPVLVAFLDERAD